MAAPTLDFAGASNKANAVASLSIANVAISAGANRLLRGVATYWSSPARTVTSMTFNTSEVLSAIASPGTLAIFGGTMTVDMRALKAPTNTTQPLAYVFSGNVSELVIGCESWTGVDQSSTFGTVATASDSNGGGSGTPGVSPTVNVASGSVDAVVVDAFTGGDQNVNMNATGTLLFRDKSAAGETQGGGQYKAGTGGSVTMNWTNGVADKVNGYVIQGVAINGITGGGGGSAKPDAYYRMLRG